MKLEFETKRLFNREYSKKDLDAFIRVTSQLSVRATTYGIPDDYTKSYAKKWFKYLKKSMRDMEGYEFGMFLKDSGEYIGNVGLINVSMIHNHADITYYTDEKYRNMGYTSEAGHEMLRFGFECLGFEKISGLCMTVNPSSRRVMEKLGMKYEGVMRDELLKNGRYFDIERHSILRNEYFTNSKVESC